MNFRIPRFKRVFCSPIILEMFTYFQNFAHVYLVNILKDPMKEKVEMHFIGLFLLLFLLILLLIKPIYSCIDMIKGKERATVI